MDLSVDIVHLFDPRILVRFEDSALTFSRDPPWLSGCDAGLPNVRSHVLVSAGSLLPG